MASIQNPDELQGGLRDVPGAPTLPPAESDSAALGSVAALPVATQREEDEHRVWVSHRNLIARRLYGSTIEVIDPEHLRLV